MFEKIKHLPFKNQYVLIAKNALFIKSNKSVLLLSTETVIIHIMHYNIQYAR